MKQNKEQIEAYKEMAKTSPESMKSMIEANLKATCDKYAGHEDRLDDCIEYMTDCAREILDSKSGDVPDEVCYRICRDYFNDELWKEADAEKAEREAKAKEKAEKAEAKKKAEKAKRDAERKKSKSNVITATLDDARDDSEDEDDADDVPAITPPKPKHCDGQLDMFAALGV